MPNTSPAWLLNTHVRRYSERHPVRAGLVPRAEQWHWSSARHWLGEGQRPSYLTTGPVPRPPDWLAWVDQAVTAGELAALRQSVVRGTPLGSAGWVARTAEQMGLQATLRPRGRPRKSEVDLVTRADE